MYICRGFYRFFSEGKNATLRSSRSSEIHGTSARGEKEETETGKNAEEEARRGKTTAIEGAGKPSGSTTFEVLLHTQKSPTCSKFIKKLFALLVPNCQQVWNNLNKLDGNIRLVTRFS